MQLEPLVIRCFFFERVIGKFIDYLMIISCKQFVFYIYYPSGYYTVVEQYYVYDIGSFVADIGGYLVMEA